MTKNNIIELKNITVEFDGEKVLDNLNLSIKDKEFVTLLGQSGCGKTTTLRIIAGFIQPQTGDVFFDGKSEKGIPPYKRPVNTVFQRYALFPNYNVYDNIAFGLRVSKVPEKEIEQRVKEMLKLVNLQGFEKRSVAKLSGGQQQRVLLARALCASRKLIVLDEPTAALDPDAAEEMYLAINDLYKSGISVIMVSHDAATAVKYATHVLHIAGRPKFFGTVEDYLETDLWKKAKSKTPGIAPKPYIKSDLENPGTAQKPYVTMDFKGSDKTGGDA